MRRYETIIIVRPNVAEDEIEAIINRTTSIIEDDEGTILQIDHWGLKKLAYLIKKESQGYYIYVDYAGVPAAVTEIERIFRIDDRILKYLTIKLADSCDPETVKEQLASAESAQASDESEEVKEEPAGAEPVESSDESEEVKDEPAVAEPVESSDESEEVKEEEAGTDEEKQAD